MSYRLAVRTDAILDIEQTLNWYEAQRPGLGFAFLRSVVRAIQELQDNPLAYRLRNRRRNLRWRLTPRFPYRIVYQVNAELVTVVAVIHRARRNRFWKDRTESP